MTELRPCRACKRHVAARDATCPFCGERRDGAAPPRLLGRSSRAAVFASATLASACWTGSSSPRTTPIEQTASSDQPAPDSIRGVTRDTRTNTPMAGVFVRVAGPAQRKTKSNSEGRFAFDQLPPGKYMLYYQAPHHRSELWMEVVLDGKAGQIVEVPIYFPSPYDNACCTPYGAPPARRRIV
jgi:hypothetical protein